MGEDKRGRKQISGTAAVVVLVLIGAALLFLGITLVRFAFYAMGKDSILIGVATLLLGIVFVAGPVAVIISQTRTMLKRRG